MNCLNSEGSAVWLLTLPDGWDWQWQAQTQTEKANQLVTIATGSGTTSLETSDKQAEVIQCFVFQPSTNMAGFRLNKSFKVWGGVLWCCSGLMLDPSGYRALYKASHALSQHTNKTWWKWKRKFRPNLWQHILCFILSYSQRNSARFPDFSRIIIKTDFWVQKNRVFLFLCLFVFYVAALVWTNQEVFSCGNICWVPSTSLSLLTELFTAQMETDSALQIPSWLKQRKDISCMCRF